MSVKCVWVGAEGVIWCACPSSAIGRLRLGVGAWLDTTAPAVVTLGMQTRPLPSWLPVRWLQLKFDAPLPPHWQACIMNT